MLTAFSGCTNLSITDKSPLVNLVVKKNIKLYSSDRGFIDRYFSLQRS